MRAVVEGLTLGFDVIGSGGQPWIITPGGRFSKDDPGVRPLAEAIAAAGNTAIIWDRPNCGESDVCFSGATESAMQADYLVALLRHLDVGPAVVFGGSGGARVSLLAVAHHPEVAAGLGLLWVSGGYYGLMNLGSVYNTPSIKTAILEDMEAVAALGTWEEVIRRNPSNRQRILDQDRTTFIRTMDRWMSAYYPLPGTTIPGLEDDLVRSITVPSLVFRSGESDWWHPRETSDAVASLLPKVTVVDPPWPDTEWTDGLRRYERGEQGGAFEPWPRLAPQLLEWAEKL